MLNQVIIVGRLMEDPKNNEITLVVPRTYKNIDGTYDTDFIDCVLGDNLASNIAEYCKKGDVVGVKGRIQTDFDDDNKKSTKIIAEKVSFLSSK